MRPERRRKLSSEGAGADIETPHAKRDPATMSMVDNLSIGSSSQKQSSSWKKSVYKAFRSLTGSRSPSIQHPPDLTEDKERDSITRDPEVLNKLQFGSVQGSASLRAETTDIFVPMKKLILPGGNHSTALGFSYYKRIRVILHTQLLGIDRSQLNLFTNFALTHWLLKAQKKFISILFLSTSKAFSFFYLQGLFFFLYIYSIFSSSEIQQIWHRAVFAYTLLTSLRYCLSAIAGICYRFIFACFFKAGSGASSSEF